MTGVGGDQAAPSCDSCVTCGDVAVRVRVAGLLPEGLALAATGAGTEEISVALVEARVGDTVLVHAGEAIAVVERAGA
ncbi:HypC/HybG/HupF family hydrogenase formation chaperone [Nonomuraea diastatica]|uniref:HypC/HybG/HupF family hydrogenase formation chaperone n=1 Tax=Nonomuraea diastatica TaxID=1848329 RepID=UPI0015F2D01C|nr:HypC/HybG/HupF family hydrogenase formation chaperone [Nonomuraea diastatica]